MGYNGANTYGVRVDSSRYADQLKTARTINGVSFDGSANITISDSTAFGINQTWQDVKASRTSGVTYTNTTGKPIQVINGHTYSPGGTPTWYVNGTLMLTASTNSNAVGVTSVMAFVIPNNATYRYDGVISVWHELR